MKLGAAYEAQVRKLTMGMKVKDAMPTAKEMAERVADGAWQVTVKSTIEIDGVLYMIYGKVDVLRKGEIVDIKTTQNFKNPDYYLEGHQHLFYLWCAKKLKWKHEKFVYLVTDFKEIHEVEFEVGDWDLFNMEVHKRLTDFIGFLKDHPDLEKAYNTKFCR